MYSQNQIPKEGRVPCCLTLGKFPILSHKFIISGSLSVAAETQPNSPCLLNGSVGLNIFSAICSAVGIILFITDISISGGYVYPDYYPYHDYSVVSVLKQRLCLY